VVATYTPDNNFSSVVSSSDAITSGEEHTVYVGGRAGGTAGGGMTLGGSTSAATKLGTVTAGRAPAGRGH
jgi:hypothetical protein